MGRRDGGRCEPLFPFHTGRVLNTAQHDTSIYERVSYLMDTSKLEATNSWVCGWLDVM